MKKNVKVIASLVRKAKNKLHQGKREEALEFMKKAVNIDDNNGVLVQVIQVIGRKKNPTEPAEEPQNIPEDPVTPVEVKSEPNTEIEEDINQEGNTAMVSDDQLNKLFEASEREYDNGHQQKAIAYLKKAKKIAPENPEVQIRIDLLKSNIKSLNLIKIARKKLNSGEFARAVELTRELFSMRPDIEGLDELLSEIESHSGTSVSSGSGDSGMEYITRIRELVQDNLLEDAASIAQKAFDIYPDNALITEFVDNFKKLGLLE